MAFLWGRTHHLLGEASFCPSPAGTRQTCLCPPSALPLALRGCCLPPGTEEERAHCAQLLRLPVPFLPGKQPGMELTWAGFLAVRMSCWCRQRCPKDSPKEDCQQCLAAGGLGWISSQCAVFQTSPNSPRSVLLCAWIPPPPVPSVTPPGASAVLGRGDLQAAAGTDVASSAQVELGHSSAGRAGLLRVPGSQHASCFSSLRSQLAATEPRQRTKGQLHPSCCPALPLCRRRHLCAARVQMFTHALPRRAAGRVADPHCQAVAYRTGHCCGQPSAGG